MHSPTVRQSLSDPFSRFRRPLTPIRAGDPSAGLVEPARGIGE
jgi:hypothetical protein